MAATVIGGLPPEARTGQLWLYPRASGRSSAGHRRQLPVASRPLPEGEGATRHVGSAAQSPPRPRCRHETKGQTRLAALGKVKHRRVLGLAGWEPQSHGGDFTPTSYISERAGWAETLQGAAKGVQVVKRPRAERTRRQRNEGTPGDEDHTASWRLGPDCRNPKHVRTGVTEQVPPSMQQQDGGERAGAVAGDSSSGWPGTFPRGIFGPISACVTSA